MNNSAEKIGVLIFPAGETNSVELHHALTNCVNVRLYGASSYDRHGEYVFADYTSGLPLISDIGFIPALNELISRKKIDMIFPTHDTVAEFLADNHEKINAKVLSSDIRTGRICRDKKLTFDLFSDCSFCPKIYEKPDNFPIFIKPRLGQGAVGAFKAETLDDIPKDFSFNEAVICEYLPGEEFTVDCFTDKNRKLCGVFPRSRNRILAGMTVNGKSEKATEEIFNIASTINSQLNFLGLWYFQIKKSANGKFKLMEISARCPGTMCITRARGVNLALLSVYAAMGRDVDVFFNDYTVTADRTLIARYKISYEYTKVYLDLDDTLIFNGKVCLNTVRFVYQCFNKGISVILLTRHGCDHKENAVEYLKRCCISPDLFKNIIELTYEQDKSDYIDCGKAVFIDNSYSERKAVHDRIGIPVFDVDGIEVLLDWRS